MSVRGLARPFCSRRRRRGLCATRRCGRRSRRAGAARHESACRRVLFRGHEVVWVSSRRVWSCAHCLRRASPHRLAMYRRAECRRTGDVSQRAALTVTTCTARCMWEEVAWGSGSRVAERVQSNARAVCRRPAQGGHAAAVNKYRLRRFLAGRRPIAEAALDGPHRLRASPLFSAAVKP